MKRVFLIVLDSFGIGAMPDAADFGDEGSSTLKSVSRSEAFYAHTLKSLGLFHIDGVEIPGSPAAKGAFMRLGERSRGKDTTTGHFEIAGLISEKPMPTYPNGFPAEIIDEFSRLTGRGVLCNKPCSGTQVIKDYGEEHLKTGKLIVYTSADSVFQVAAHEKMVSNEQLYAYCRIARKLLSGEHGVGRVIARPFTGTAPHFERTPNRHDFSLKPFGRTMLDALCEGGFEVIGVGKIGDIFADTGLTRTLTTKGNADGMAKTELLAGEEFTGLCFVNLVDFDMLYGHRRNPDGYAAALTEFDAWLANFLPRLKAGDILMITADHGCDPGKTDSTDHTREYVPLIAFGEGVRPGNLGTRECFADIAATVCEYFGVKLDTPGKSFLKEML